MSDAPLSSNEVAEYPKDLAGYLRKCSLCGDTGVTEWGTGICPRCGGPESVERRAADALDQLTARVSELELEVSTTKESLGDATVLMGKYATERDRLRAALVEVQPMMLRGSRAAGIINDALAGTADETTGEQK